MKPWDPENAAELWGRGAYLGTSSNQAVGSRGTDSLKPMGGKGEAAVRARGPEASAPEPISPIGPSHYTAPERRWLREELLQIRADQHSYLSRSLVLTTGVIVFLLGLSSALEAGAASSLRLCLLPLLITLPSWWLFFDRECSLSRIVGYLRVLDRIDSPEADRSSARFRLEGWELALSQFRDVQELSTPSRLPVWKRGFYLALADALLMRGTQRKLTIHWYSFALLAAVPLALAFPAGRTRIEFLVSSAIVFVSGIYNLYLLGDLNGGRRSYDGAELMWTRVLRRTGCPDDDAFDELTEESSAPNPGRQEPGRQGRAVHDRVTE